MQQTLEQRMKYGRQNGTTLVEFAFIGSLFFTILFGLIQYAELTKDRSMLTEAAVKGARLFSAKRGFATPCAATQTLIRNMLTGTLANATVVGNSVNMTLDIACPTNPLDCACASPTKIAGQDFCVTTCFSGKINTTCNENLCSSYLGTDALEPPTGTAARVTLTYGFTPLFKSIGATNITSLSSTMSDTLK